MSKCGIFTAHKKAHKTLDLGCCSMTYGVARAEKAGVGGSTPSLATIILKNLAELRLALPVRSQSAIFRRDPVQHSQRRTAKEAQGSRTNAGRTHIGWQVKERLL